MEPAEIEAALAQHPNVRQGVVVARQTQAGDTKLYAYLSTSNFRPLSVADLRAYLKTKIPEYMVPAAFIWLKELPIEQERQNRSPVAAGTIFNGTDCRGR